MARNGFREDVGEKIGGARKDRWNYILNRKFKELLVTDFEEHCKKIKLWDLNSIKEIEDPFWKLCVLTMRDSYPSKPVFKKLTGVSTEESELYQKEMNWLYLKDLEIVKGIMEKGMENYSKNAWEGLKELTEVEFTPAERVYLRNSISYSSSYFIEDYDEADKAKEEMQKRIEDNKEKMFFLINARNPSKSTLQFLSNKKYLYQRMVDNLIKFTIKNKTIEVDNQKYDLAILLEDLFYKMNPYSKDWVWQVEEWWKKESKDENFLKVFNALANSIVSPSKKQVLDKLEETKKSIKDIKKEYNYVIKENIKQADYFQIRDVVRKGYSWRKGKTIPSTKSFIEEFGFRGLEFGEWVKTDKEREAVLNLAYDAFRDLGLALGIEKTELSLPPKNPTQIALATAFGSRGVAGAKAHFEPTRNVFNLTRMKGAGSLAHEMGHAFEFYENGICANNISEYIAKYKDEDEKNLMQVILYKNRDKEGQIKALQDELVQKFNGAAEVSYDFGEWTKEEFKEKVLAFKDRLIDMQQDFFNKLENKVKVSSDEEVQTMLSFRRGISVTTLFNLIETNDYDVNMPKATYNYEEFMRKIKDVALEFFPEVKSLSSNNLRNYVTNMRILADKVISHKALEVIDKNSNNYTMEKGTIPTNFYNSAVEMDHVNIKPYYSQPTELRARAFEMYVFEKLKEKGVSNYYLTKDEEHYSRTIKITKLNFFDREETLENQDTSLFPQGIEKERIIKAFDKVFLKYKRENYPAQEIVVSHELKGSKLQTISEQQLKDGMEEFKKNLKNIKEPPKVQLSLF